MLFPFYVNQNLDLWANCMEASQGGPPILCWKCNVAQVKLMLSLSMHEIIWYALGIVKFLNTGYGVTCRNPRTLLTSPLILLSGGYGAPRVTCSSQSPGLHMLCWALMSETMAEMQDHC